MLCLEAGLHKIEFLAWLRFLRFWLRTFYVADQNIVLRCILADSTLSLALALFYKKLRLLGLSLDVIQPWCG